MGDIVVKSNLKKVQEYIKKNRSYIVSIVIIIIILAIFLGVKNENSKKMDKFAQCLTSNGAKMYGAFWCSHCASQKKKFGSSFKFIEYIECDPKGRNSQEYLCQEKGIKTYPTWEFEDGSLFRGVMSLETLGEKTGCEVP